MAILDKQGLQHYANKMCNADNRKVGSKSLPTALNDIDTAIDGFKTLFKSEYGTPVNMELENNENVFSIGTGTNIDKKDDVENSFTDVELSGNSLVNLCPQTYNFTTVTTKGEAILDGLDVTYNSPTYRIKAFTLTQPLKPNTTYTAIVNILSLVNSGVVASYVKYSDGEAVYNQFSATQLGLNIKKFTTSNKIATELAYYLNGECSAKISGVIILEGDWTNKPIPQYFEGLKSVGEKEDGNHKISILSLPSNPNLIQTHCTVPSKANWSGTVTDSPTELIEDISCPNGKYIKILSNSNDKTELGRYIFPTEKLEIGKKYSWSFWCKSNKNLATRCGAEQGGTKIINITPTWQKFTHTFTAINSVYWAFIFYLRNAQVGDYICVHSIKLEEGESITDWCPNNEEIYKNLVSNYSKFNKKEISLNEPLRGLPNGVKDTIEKVNGEWKIVRRCSEVVLNGSEPWMLLSDTDKEKTIGFRILNFLPLSRYGDKYKMVVCDRFPSYKHNLWKKDYEGITTENNINDIINDTQLQIIISKSELSTENIAGFKQWLSQNPTRVIYELETPIIEDVSPLTLQCWKNGTISIDEVLPVETTHTVALNKSAQIQKNIEELTILRNRVKALEEQYDKTALNQAYEVELLRLDMQLDNII